MAKLSYLFLILFSLWISFFQILNLNMNVGEFSPFPLVVSGIEIFCILLLNSFLFVVFYFIAAFSNKKKFVISKRFTIKLNQHRLNIVFLALLSLQLLFLIVTGVGRLLSDATHPFSPLFAIFSPDAFFPIYYLINRVKTNQGKNKLFFISVFLFSLLKILQGWSAFILVIAFLELFYRTSMVKLKFKTVFIATLIPLLVLLVGGGVYSYVYKLKNTIRGNSVTELSYYEGVEQLASRLSMLPVSIAAYERTNSVVTIFQKDAIEYKEIMGLGRPILPRFIMQDKEFRPLGNNVMEAYYPDITDKTSSNMGLFMYLYILTIADVSQALMFIIVVSLLIFVVKLFLDSIEQYPRQLSFVLFMLLMNVVDIASLEVVFGYGFIKALTVFMLCFLFGAFKIVLKNITCSGDK